MNLVRFNTILRAIPRMPFFILTTVAFVLSVSGVVWASLEISNPETSKPAPQLAAMLPQGALLTIESTDFSALLNAWNNSPEKAQWLKTDNYEQFSRSRLFGRLGAAQDEFAKAAGLAPDMSFLKEVAGQQSIFAWYDIGNLEFLYITRITSASAEKSRLLELRSKFQLRRVGTQSFYVRTQSDETMAQPRTVVFATSGDWLLLATREDLMANALTLIDSAAQDQNADKQSALNSEPWFADAHAAAPKNAGQIRMTLNLAKIVPSPYFRSYWVQRNTTELKQFRSAISDLYMHKDQYREERIILPKVPDAAPPATSDLSALTALLPAHSGVFRASSYPSIDLAVETLNEKLIEREIGSQTNSATAPNADLSTLTPVTSNDFETRIETAPPTSPLKNFELFDIRGFLATQSIDGMMTINRTDEVAAQDLARIYVPFQSAVLLSSSRDWDEATLKSALQTAFRARLTAAHLGLEWKSLQASGRSYSELGDARPLQLAILGKICILTDDSKLMTDILARNKSDQQSAATSELSIGGFSSAQESDSFARWTKDVDHAHGRPVQDSNAPGSPHEPSFFNGNLLSFSKAFEILKSERVEERREGPLTKQTVTYTWNH